MFDFRNYFFRALQPALFIRWIALKKRIPPPHIVKVNIIRNLQKKLQYSAFIETGTYKGGMIDAQKNNFSSIYSIELGETLAMRAKHRFLQYRHIHIYCGDSASILPKILPKLRTPCIFWLDAHYSGGVTKKNNSDTPIMSELHTILSSSGFAHVILIDDARLFTGRNDYPTIQAVTSLVKKYRSGARIYQEDDILNIFL